MFGLRLVTFKPRIANLQMILDGSRVLEHKKYQMYNQVQFSQLTRQHPSKFLEKNEVSLKLFRLKHAFSNCFTKANSLISLILVFHKISEKNTTWIP